MSDRLSLSKIEILSRIGITQQEREHPQKLLVSVIFFHSLQATCESDDITQGIDYASVLECILLLAASPRATIERFASDVVDSLLHQFSPEDGIEVTVEKFPFPDVQSVSVTLRRP